jgi:ERCC4-type nuclease
MITIKIDSRENKLKDRLKESAEQLCNTLCDNLYCGDFIIEFEQKPIIVIERKTLPDLVASIRDGRYRVQKAKLIDTFGRDAVTYVIEGQFDYSPSQPLFIEGMDKYSVISSLINTHVRDGLHVVHTQNLNDTHDYIIALLTRVVKDPNKYITNNNVVCQKQDMIVKNKINSKEDLFFYQLTEVPGISAKTAQAFVDTFGSIKKFYDEMSNINNEEKLKLLKNIFITDNNKKRRISSKVADNILNYMLL